MNVIPYDSKPIAAPGLFSGVPMARYHGQLTAGASASRSGLWRIFDESPAHYFLSSYLNPEAEPQEESEALVFGRAAHHLLLGEADFDKHFVIRPDKWDSWRTNDAKAWRAEQQLAGFTVLEPKHLEHVRGMASGLMAQPLIRAGILNGLIEHTMVWQDEETGIWLKARPDVIPNHSGDVADMKCVADVSDDGIARGLGDRGYHQQGALVGEALRRTLDLEMQHFTLCYVEQKKPHCVRFDEVPSDELAAGAAENRAALRLLKRAFETNYWPGPKSLQGDGGAVRRTSWTQRRAADRLAAIEQELMA